MSPASKAQQKAVNKYMKKNYDRVNLVMPKGRKDAIRTHAEKNGESLNSFINRAIDEAMERDEKADREELSERKSLWPEVDQYQLSRPQLFDQLLSKHRGADGVQIIQIGRQP